MNKAQKYLMNNKMDDLRVVGGKNPNDWVYVSDVMESYKSVLVNELKVEIETKDKRIETLEGCLLKAMDVLRKVTK